MGPTASPSAWPAACTPSAARSRRVGRGGGTLVVTSATLLAWSIAAPTACMTRKPTSIPRLGASPQAADATVKVMKP